MTVSRLVVFLIAASTLWGQPAQGNPGRKDGPPPPPPPVRSHGPMEGPGGMWWDRPEMVKKLDITADQQKKMDEVFQQNRLRLIDLRTALEKEEVGMEGLMKGPQLDDAKILPAVDRIAQARAELEKADARLLLALRHVLTPEQWQKLNTDQPHPHHPGPPPKDGPVQRGGPPPPAHEE